MTLLVISTHPIQYHAPVYGTLQQEFDVPTTVIYASDFSIVGYKDKEFGVSFAWDTNLLSGYKSIFLSRVANGGAKSVADVQIKGLRQAIANETFQAVLLLGYSPKFYLPALLVARETKRPLLFRAETTDQSLQRGLLKNRMRDEYLKWFYRPIAKLLYIGENSLAHYRRLGYDEDKLVFAPYCVSTANFQTQEEDRQKLRQVTRDELGIRADQSVLLFSGKIVHRKGPDLLISAIKQLPEAQREQFVVLFLGEGDMKEMLQAASATSPYVQVHFVGFQNQTQLSRYYHAADLLVMPSRYSETWGLVVNEALHHGLPCLVSSQVGCSPDLIKEGVTGAIFEAESVTHLADRLQTTLALINRVEVRSWCRAHVEKYSVHTAASGIAQAYRAVVGY